MPRQPRDSRGPPSLLLLLLRRRGGNRREPDLSDGGFRRLLQPRLLLALLRRRRHLLLEVHVVAGARLLRGPDLDDAVDAAGGEAMGRAGPRDGRRLFFYDYLKRRRKKEREREMSSKKKNDKRILSLDSKKKTTKPSPFRYVSRGHAQSTYLSGCPVPRSDRGSPFRIESGEDLSCFFCFLLDRQTATANGGEP